MKDDLKNWTKNERKLDSREWSTYYETSKRNWLQRKRNSQLWKSSHEIKAQYTEITKLKKETKDSVNIENTNDAATATNKIENILTSVKRKKNEDYYSRDSLLQEVIKHRTELEKKGEESL